MEKAVFLDTTEHRKHTYDYNALYNFLTQHIIVQCPVVKLLTTAFENLVTIEVRRSTVSAIASLQFVDHLHEVKNNCYPSMQKSKFTFL